MNGWIGAKQAPWQLTLGDRCSIGERVSLYNAGTITVGSYSTISQDTVLCTGSHDHHYLHLPSIVKEIAIGEHVWLCAGVFVMPGVTVGDGTVIGARSLVLGPVAGMKVAAGSPCRVIGERELR